MNVPVCEMASIDRQECDSPLIELVVAKRIGERNMHIIYVYVYVFMHP